MKNMKNFIVCMMSIVVMSSLTACTEDPSKDSNVNSATDGTQGIQKEVDDLLDGNEEINPDTTAQ